jgi:pyruvate/2-oxoglutarate dehydrogenase complex dihydrolipoamide acyltransferase (E2) component
MSTLLKIPALGQGMIEGLLSEWLVADGAQVAAGDPIYALESEKSVQEVEAPVSGILRIVCDAGETYPVSTVIGRIE